MGRPYNVENENGVGRLFSPFFKISSPNDSIYDKKHLVFTWSSYFSAEYSGMPGCCVEDYFM